MSEINGQLTTLLALPPEEGGYANDPILGVVKNLGLSRAAQDAAEIYVGVLAATILVIATNAGVIGASRITYSMATYRQLPEVFRRLHPRFKTPWLSIVLFAGIAADRRSSCPGDVNFIGTLYSLGRDAVVHDRPRVARPHALGDRRQPRCRTARARTSGSAPFVAVVRDRRRDRDRDLVPRPRRPEPAHALGGPRLDGRSGSWATRSTGAAPCASRCVPSRRRRRRSGRPSPSSTGTCSSPSSPGQPSDAAMDVACRLASERRARIVALNVLEVPLDQRARPIASRARGEREPRARPGGRDRRLVRRARPDAARAGALRRAGDRRGGDARNAEIIVLGSPRRHLTAAQSAVFGKTVDYVLKHANCRVLVTAAEPA